MRSRVVIVAPPGNPDPRLQRWAAWLSAALLSSEEGDLALGWRLLRLRPLVALVQDAPGAGHLAGLARLARVPARIRVLSRTSPWPPLACGALDLTVCRSAEEARRLAAKLPDLAPERCFVVPEDRPADLEREALAFVLREAVMQRTARPRALP
jgi:hypothetical protein